MSRKSTKSQEVAEQVEAQDATQEAPTAEVIIAELDAIAAEVTTSDVVPVADVPANVPARMVWKQRGETLPVREGHEMRYNCNADYYRKPRDLKILTSADSGAPFRWDVRMPDGAECIIYARYDGHVKNTLYLRDLSDDSITLEMHASWVIGVHRARREDARELKAVRQEGMKALKPAKPEKPARVASASVATLAALKSAIPA